MFWIGLGLFMGLTSLGILINFGLDKHGQYLAKSYLKIAKDLDVDHLSRNLQRNSDVVLTLVEKYLKYKDKDIPWAQASSHNTGGNK